MSFKKENKQQKTKKKRKKTAYLLLGCGPVGNAGRAGVCGNPIGTDQLGG
jgi:hypothetical protein